jgi:hypothetical protein
MAGLAQAQRLIEENHAACHRVVQQMGKKYPQCHDKIWKYDWAPAGTRSSTRKSWRMVAIVPEPFKQPYHIIAAAIYPKSDESQLTVKQLATIFAAVTGGFQGPHQQQDTEPNFRRISTGDGKTMSLCGTCGEKVSVSAVEQELQDGEEKHECSGSPFSN